MCHKSLMYRMGKTLQLSLPLLLVATVRCLAICDPLKQSILPRVFILTDISNEPDDAESLVRLLVHSDLYNITGLSAVTSYWLNSSTYPDEIHSRISNYSIVYNNLQAHTTGSFPLPSYLHDITFSGPTSYGLAALGEPLSNATSHLIAVVDSSDQPLYVAGWGGVNTLAQALSYVSTTRSSNDINRFISKLRVYAISDQDNSGFWIRTHFPTIRYISSTHAWNYYGDATWPGISGEEYYFFDTGGPDTSLVSKAWLATHIQVGPLGASYPTPAFIMEGDTPSLLFTIQNGLNDASHPEYGGWGGRYRPADLSLASGNHFADTADYVRGANGQTFVSNKATIWRWREAYQSEFAARMQWTLSPDYGTAQHPPVAIVNDSCGFDPLTVSVLPGQRISLDASASTSLDSEMQLTFNWTHYREITMTQWNIIEVPEIQIDCLMENCTQVSMTVPNASVACTGPAALHMDPAGITCQVYHVILTVRNKVTLGMSRYKRVILDVQTPTNLTVGI